MKQEHIDQIEAAASAIWERVEAGKATHVYFVACGGSQASMMRRISSISRAESALREAKAAMNVGSEPP